MPCGYLDGDGVVESVSGTMFDGPDVGTSFPSALAGEGGTVARPRLVPGDGAPEPDSNGGNVFSTDRL